MTNVLRVMAAVWLSLAAVFPAMAADWPMWRFDAKRSAVSPTPLPPRLHLNWSRELPPESPAWPDQEKMPFDICFEPIVVGKTLYLNSSRNDSVRAVDVVSGESRWEFFADGPVRFAPLHHNGKLYFVSDDGHLYCLDADSGTLAWKVRGGPNDRRILGNERLISTWPARGAPVIADGTLYFAASIWPFMGVFIHAVEPDTGKILWTNDGDGSMYMKQPHSTDAFASVAPQGPLAVDGDFLVIPGGRSIPAIFDRRSGKLLKLPLAENGKLGGGSSVTTAGNVYFNGGAVFETATSKYQGAFGNLVLPGSDVIFAFDRNALKAYDAKSYHIVGKEPKKAAPPSKDSGGVLGEIAKAVKPAKISRWKIEELAAISLPPIEVLIQAGDRIYAGGENIVFAIDYDSAAKEFDLAWQTKLDGTVCRLVAGADRLFAATEQGALYCFGADEVAAKHHPLRVETPPAAPSVIQTRAQALISAGGARDGYAVALGYGDGKLVQELIQRSKLRVIAIEPDANAVADGRTANAAAGTYGERVALIPGNPRDVALPPYFCSVVFADDLKSAGVACDEEFLSTLFTCLRPFGGRLILSATDTPAWLESWAERTPQARVSRQDDLVIVSRDGPLPGSANWTHEHTDSSNTRVGKDTLVKAPMGILWFGGPSHEGVLPRHGHGPQPQVIDGRMLIEGVDMLRCLDIYTGRLLWETKLPGVGKFYNNVAHQAGANASGGNFVSTSDAIYVAWDFQCVVLDPATGKIKSSYKLPTLPGAKGATRWGYLNVEGDHLIAGADPIFDAKNLPPKDQGTGNDDDKANDKDKDKSIISKSLSKVVKALKPFSDNMSASRHLYVLDRHSGQVIWKTTANHGFRHNGVCLGNGRIYAIDRLSGDELAKRKIKPGDLKKPFRVVAYDLFTGDEMWEIDDDVFGTWLSYSDKHDILVEAGRLARDTLKDEPRGVRALNARTGEELWFVKSYAGPAMIHGDEILLDSGACDLRDGGLKLRDDPITGLPVPWKWIRTYGCNTPTASQNMLLFRSGAAGYFDLSNDGGTGNFGGFRSSCTNNLIAAGGVLTVPEYTRTCVCNYQNQTSVALVHMPETEMWTYFGTKDVKGPVRKVGINLGAVGDRRAENGVLWLDYPSTGGVSPSVGVTLKPSATDLYRRFSGHFNGRLPWVASSGVKGLEEIAIAMGKNENKVPRLFTVRLVFAEPEAIAVGARRFHVALQGERKLESFDIVAEAGGPQRSVIKEFRGVSVVETLTIQFFPAASESRPPVLSGIEIVEE